MLDEEACYRAIASRDSRFDGRFVTAVTTTGIYCRPSCPAQTPRRENVRFYRAAAAAVAAGFRACKRCRPEAAPGSRDWDVRSDLAARALRAIGGGLVDDGGVPALARSLAVSERHLHRILVAEVGAGPLALARTRRAQTARLLLDATTLPVTDIAHAAGFASIRQFNDTMRAHFGAPPTELRRGRGAPAAGGAMLTLRVAYRPPYAVAPMVDWLARHTVAGLESMDGDTWQRALPNAAVVALTPGDGAWLLRLRVPDVAHVADAVARCRRLLDADADPSAVDAALGADPLLGPLVAERPGLRVPGAVDGVELAVRTVLGQQVSVAAAQTFAARLVQAYGQPLDEPAGTVTHRFPTAEALADATFEEVGITTARARCLRALAQACADGLTLDPSADRSDTRAALLALPGIGPWTADYLAMRALGDPDAFVPGDLVLRRRTAGIDPARWSPWRAYAAMHLWTDHLAALPLPTPATTARPRRTA